MATEVKPDPGPRARRAMALTAKRNALAPQTGDAENLAKVFTSTPSLRAAFFANPTKAIGALLPPPRYWTYRTKVAGWQWLNPLNLSTRYRCRLERAVLAKSVFDQICNEIGSDAMTASINTDSVFAEYFAPMVKVSDRSYSSIYYLSWAAFTAGVGLIVLGGVIGLAHPKGVDGTALAGIFGGAGALSTLGSIYGLVVSGLREATYDAARTRVTLAGFAAQLGTLRAVFEGKLKKPADGLIADVTPVTEAISKALAGALAGVDMSSSTADNGTANKTNGTTNKTNGTADKSNGTADKTDGTAKKVAGAAKKAPAKKQAQAVTDLTTSAAKANQEPAPAS
jgi:hypothetical protein